jgi:outer membrane receptor protein involved in Fe transport
MTLKTTKLRDAITFALAVGATATAGMGVAFAQDATAADQQTTPQAEEQAKTLDRIEVTGSRIRRVDAENASPVVTIDRAAIEKTGKLTLGDLVQELPNIAGAATNPQVNNGGGDGSSAIDLRGLGSSRTLMLINGRRIVNADVNAIPASAVERIEVLTVGASSVYGSDAVAGVVNFIMRKDFEGLQASIDYGISSRDDGQRQGVSVTFGQVGERGNVIAGINYNKFDAISSGDRDYSKFAMYLSTKTVYGRDGSIGSSRNPRGRIYLPPGNPYGCSSVTRIEGATGDSLDDYRCYAGTDAYNYQAVNLVLTPQERTNAFFLGNFQITDDVNAFMEYYHNKTSANFAIAALPFDAQSDGVTISADNYYNPFGVEFGPADGARQFMTRWTSLGQRRSLYNTVTDQLVTGLEGFLGETWKWDFALNYGHYSSTNTSYGYVDYAGLSQAMGPSFMDTDGVVKCGAPGAIIANCTPMNVFNIDDPQSIATLAAYQAKPVYSTLYIQKGFEANASGELFDLPAGAAQLAFGAQWRRESQRSEVDYIAISDAEGQCMISQEACSSPVGGNYSVSELYAELFLPLLKDVPFAQALNLTIGTRYSDYSNFGSNTSSKVQVEWRPSDELLLRGTVAEVFRAPTISDIFSGPGGNAPQASDPCVGWTPGDAAHAAACGPDRGTDVSLIPAGGIEPTGLSQTTGVVSGSAYAGYDLGPEQGRSFDWGLVYDPSWLPGFSVSLDYWRLFLNDYIQTVGAQTVLDACYADSGSPFCGFIHRRGNGWINYISQPTVNLGRMDAKGWDLALRYRLPDTAMGSWTFGFDGTYIDRFTVDLDTTSDIDVPKYLAGTYNKDFGNYSRVRARLFANWSMGDWSASWRVRYVGPYDVGSNDLEQLTSADGMCAEFPNPVTGQGPEYCYAKPYPSYMLHSVNVGYALPSINSRIELGVDNVFDKQPPVLYQNNVLNANTDVSTFDTVGRYFWARYTVKF